MAKRVVEFIFIDQARVKLLESWQAGRWLQTQRRFVSRNYHHCNEPSFRIFHRNHFSSNGFHLMECD